MDQATPILADPTQDPALLRFAAAVRAQYGDRVERIVLFGSRARGDARADSDYDVAVFLRDIGNWWQEVGRLGCITDDVLYRSGAVISPKPFASDEYGQRTALMGEIRRDGREL